MLLCTVSTDQLICPANRDNQVPIDKVKGGANPTRELARGGTDRTFRDFSAEQVLVLLVDMLRKRGDQHGGSTAPRRERTTFSRCRRSFVEWSPEAQSTRAAGVPVVMPFVYFHRSDGKAYHRDRQGRYLKDVEQAKAEAKRILARELTRAEPTIDTSGLSVTVEDLSGRTLFMISAIATTW